MKKLIIEVTDDFDIDDFNSWLDNMFGLEVKEVINIGFKGVKCELCGKEFEDLLGHFVIDHNLKNMEDLKKKLKGEIKNEYEVM